MSVEEKLKELGLELPSPPQAVAAYVPAVRVGNLLFTSGTAAKIGGVRRYVGKVGREVTLEEGYLSARDAMLNNLSIVKSQIGSLDKVERIIKVTGFVNSAPGFDQQPQVVNGASELLEKLFGERGKHARSAVGVAELPFGISVETEMIVQVQGNPD